MILDLRKNAFESTSDSKRQIGHADDYKKLGFAVSIKWFVVISSFNPVCG